MLPITRFIAVTVGVLSNHAVCTWLLLLQLFLMARKPGWPPVESAAKVPLIDGVIEFFVKLFTVSGRAACAQGAVTSRATNA